MWFQNETGFNEIDTPDTETLPGQSEAPTVDGKGMSFLTAKSWLSWIGSGARRGKFALKFWNINNEPLEYQAETSPSSHNSNPVIEEGVGKASREDPHHSFFLSAKETLRAAVFHFGRKWHRRLTFIWRHVKQIAGSLWRLWVR